MTGAECSAALLAMNDPKSYTESEVRERERKAFVEGAHAAWSYEGMAWVIGQLEAEAASRYPD